MKKNTTQSNLHSPRTFPFKNTNKNHFLYTYEVSKDSPIKKSKINVNFFEKTNLDNLELQHNDAFKNNNNKKINIIIYNNNKNIHTFKG